MFSMGHEMRHTDTHTTANSSIKPKVCQMYLWAYASVSTGPHTHKQQTHSPNISVFCVWVLQAKRLCVNDNARDSIATGDSMSMLTFFTRFTWKSLAVFFVYWCCAVFVWKVWLFLKNYFYFFLRFDLAGPLKISNGSGTRQTAEWESTSYSVFKLQATCFFILFVMT